MKEQIWQSILSFAGEEEQEKERLTELLSEPAVSRSGRKARHLRRVGRVSVRAVAMGLLAAFFVTAGPMKMVAEAYNGAGTVNASAIPNNENVTLTGDLTIVMDVSQKSLGKINLCDGLVHYYTLTVKGNGSGQTLNVSAAEGNSAAIDSDIDNPAGGLVIEGAKVIASAVDDGHPAVRVGTLTMGNGSELQATGHAHSVQALQVNGATVIVPNPSNWSEDGILMASRNGDWVPSPNAILRGPTISKKEEAAQEAVQPQYIPPHVHEYVWETTKEPTEEEDGEECYICKGCGAVQYRIPLTGCGAFNINTMNKILNAKPGETLHISTTHWISFHKMIGDALAQRPDVTLVVDFLSEGHKGEPMSFTIPAGAGGPALFNADGYAGFHYLSGLFATGQ
ncbi:MAG: hypothetical protein K6B72_05485 [Lachnospiraceae bacterium]|nr:hypothetical protein [Lachnospiraceae bacterium]